MVIHVIVILAALAILAMAGMAAFTDTSVAQGMPRPMIGPINGDNNIAPITTAGEESSKPRIAMPPDIAVMNR